MDMSEMNDFFTPFGHGRELVLSAEAEGSWLAWAHVYEEQGDVYNADQCRAHARKIAEKRAEKEAAEAEKEGAKARSGEEVAASKPGASGDGVKAEGKNLYKFR